jgi:hypothetical protein
VIHAVLCQLPPSSSILAGAILGEHHACALSEQAIALSAPAVRIVLDFHGVESVTASYLKAFFKVFAPAAAHGVQLYPLVANLDTIDLRFELESYLAGRDLAIQEVALDSGAVSPTAVVGQLDDSAQQAYRELNELGAATAGALHDRNPSVASKQTLWNNRLVRLFQLRLAHRTRVGRQWVYQPAFNL